MQKDHVSEVSKDVLTTTSIEIPRIIETQLSQNSTFSVKENLDESKSSVNYRKIYCDAAPAAWEKIVNRFGKKIRGENGFKWAVVDENGITLASGINTKVKWQIEGEAFALLKAIEYVKSSIPVDSRVTIFNDNQCVVSMDFRSKTAAGKYIFIAKKMLQEAKELGIEIEVSYCPGAKNKADGESRSVYVVD